MGRTEICGGIASGKTSLTKMLAMRQYTPVFENYDENPFLGEFYGNVSASIKLETEMFFLMHHAALIKRYSDSVPLICDFSIQQDYAYAAANLSKGDREVFFSLYRHYEEILSPPTRIVYLKCGIECLLNRIRQRGRAMEKVIDWQYLDTTLQALDDRMSQLGKEMEIITIDSEKYDFIYGDVDEIHRLIFGR